jgi:hypothetical protein
MLLGVDEVAAGQLGYDAAGMRVVHFAADVLDRLALFKERCGEADGEREAPGKPGGHVDLRVGVAARVWPAFEVGADHCIVEPGR